MTYVQNMRGTERTYMYCDCKSRSEFWPTHEEILLITRILLAKLSLKITQSFGRPSSSSTIFLFTQLFACTPIHVLFTGTRM